jgi:hypothetical protein
MGRGIDRPSDFRISGRWRRAGSSHVASPGPRVATRRPTSPPEWPRGVRLRGGHGGRHGPDARSPCGAREVSSVDAGAGALQRASEWERQRSLRRRRTFGYARAREGGLSAEEGRRPSQLRCSKSTPPRRDEQMPAASLRAALRNLGNCSRRAAMTAPRPQTASHAELQVGLGTAGDWIAWASRLRRLDFSTARKRGNPRATSYLETTRFTYAWTAANALFSRDRILKRLHGGKLPNSELDRFLLLYR